MRVKSLLVVTAIVSMALGAIVVYLVLTVPNDIQAGALLKSARKDIAAGRTDRARDELARIVQQYPRTDAAAAATVALATLEVHERQALQAALDALRRESASQKTQIAELQKKVETLATAPPPAPAPAAKPAPAKPPAKKKAPPKRSRRHR